MSSSKCQKAFGTKKTLEDNVTALPNLYVSSNANPKGLQSAMPKTGSLKRVDTWWTRARVAKSGKPRPVTIMQGYRFQKESSDNLEKMPKSRCMHENLSKKRHHQAIPQQCVRLPAPSFSTTRINLAPVTSHCTSEFVIQLDEIEIASAFVPSIQPIPGSEVWIIPAYKPRLEARKCKLSRSTPRRLAHSKIVLLHWAWFLKLWGYT